MSLAIWKIPLASALHLEFPHKHFENVTPEGDCFIDENDLQR